MSISNEEARERLYRARQIVQAVVRAADAGFEFHYALETVMDLLDGVTDELPCESAERAEAEPEEQS